jgi:hypothetical protein
MSLIFSELRKIRKLGVLALNNPNVSGTARLLEDIIVNVCPSCNPWLSALNIRTHSTRPLLDSFWHFDNVASELWMC